MIIDTQLSLSLGLLFLSIISVLSSIIIYLIIKLDIMLKVLVEKVSGQQFTINKLLNDKPISLNNTESSHKIHPNAKKTLGRPFHKQRSLSEREK